MLRLSILAALIAEGVLSAAPLPRSFHRPFTFEPNQGQAPSQIKWLGQSSGYQVLLNAESARIVIPDKTDRRAASIPLPGTPRTGQRNYSTVSLKLVGSRPWKDITGASPAGGVSNYLNSRDIRRSINNVPQYGRVKVAGVYEGIDLILYANDGNLEYDFDVAPGADPEQIQVLFDGAKEMRVDAKSGDLVLALPDGSELRQLRPKVYQEVGGKRVEIAGRYRIVEQKRATFTLAAYDRREPLVIDPRLMIARSIGGSADDQAMAVAVDDAGNTYFTGSTFSVNLPVTDTTGYLHCNPFGLFGFCGMGTNSFAAKVNSDGSIGFVTYMWPGSGSGIAVDTTGVYITGQFVPPDQNVVFWPFDNLNGELFVIKLSLTGQSGFLQFAGGPGVDFGSSIALDELHNIWAVGVKDLGVGTGDVLVVKLAPNGTKLFEGTFGSSGEDQGLGVAVADRQPWITGKTCGNGFPTTDGVQHVLNHCAVFVLQLDENGHEEMGMVFGGTQADDAGVGIVTNGSETAFVTGYTNSTRFPDTQGQIFIGTFSTQLPWGFITEVTNLNSVGAIVRSATFDAPQGSVTPYAIANDNRGGIYVAGTTSSLSFPRATSPGQSSGNTGFVAKFKADLSQFDYSVLLGRTLTGVALRGPLPVFSPEAACGQCFPEIYVAGWDDGIFNDPISPSDAIMVKMIDDTPTSFATSAASQVNANPFIVSWGGSSPLSSVASFDVFVSDNGGSFTPFLTATTATSAPFTGVPGHTYGFFSIATDAAGNREPMKTRADITIKIADVIPPVISPQVTGTLGSNGWYRSAVTVSWSVSDPESGIRTSTGCAPSNLTVDTAGVTLTCSATNGVGLTTSVPITIKIDKTPPVISGMPTLQCSPPNHPVLEVDNVSATDGGSGLVPNSFTVNLTRNDPSSHSFPPQIEIMPNGPDTFIVINASLLANGNGPMFSLTATAMDKAGNTATATATCGH